MKTTIKSIAVALSFCAAAFLTVSAIIENTAPNGSEKYIMRDYNGRIAVFVYGEDEPQEVFDVFTSSLPRGEAERVYKGITVEGDEVAAGDGGGCFEQQVEVLEIQQHAEVDHHVERHHAAARGVAR